MKRHKGRELAVYALADAVLPDGMDDDPSELKQGASAAGAND